MDAKCTNNWIVKLSYAMRSNAMQMDVLSGFPKILQINSMFFCFFFNQIRRNRGVDTVQVFHWNKTSKNNRKKSKPDFMLCSWNEMIIFTWRRKKNFQCDIATKLETFPCICDTILVENENEHFCFLFGFVIFHYCMLHVATVAKTKLNAQNHDHKHVWLFQDSGCS